jgi:hypothetical protein
MHFRNRDEAIIFTYYVHIWCWNLPNFQQLLDLVYGLGLYEEYLHWFYTNQLPSQRTE